MAQLLKGTKNSVDHTRQFTDHTEKSATSALHCCRAVIFIQFRRRLQFVNAERDRVHAVGAGAKEQKNMEKYLRYQHVKLRRGGGGGADGIKTDKMLKMPLSESYFDLDKG
jgi:hypothetical protein